MGHGSLRFLEKNQNVVKVDKNKMVQEISEDVVYQTLKNSWGVSQSKGHYLELAKGMLNAVFHSPPSWRSKFKKIVACCSGLETEMIRGRGYLFFTVILLRPR